MTFIVPMQHLRTLGIQKTSVVISALTRRYHSGQRSRQFSSVWEMCIIDPAYISDMSHLNKSHTIHTSASISNSYWIVWIYASSGLKCVLVCHYAHSWFCNSQGGHAMWLGIGYIRKGQSQKAITADRVTEVSAHSELHNSAHYVSAPSLIGGE